MRYLLATVLSAFILSTTQAPTHAATCDIIVGSDQPIKSIQVGINQAQPNQTICITPGTYRETIKIKNNNQNQRLDNITLKSSSNQKPIIDGNHNIPEKKSQSLIQISAHNVTITGIHLKDSFGRGITVNQSQPPFRLENVRITDNIISGSYSHAITIQDSNHTLIQNNLVEYNSSQVRGGAQINPRGSDHTQIIGNIIRYGHGQGIITDANTGVSTNTIITDNILHDNYGTGMYWHAVPSKNNHSTFERNLVFHSNMNPFLPKSNRRCLTLTGVEWEDAKKIEKDKGINNFGGITVKNNIFWGCTRAITVGTQASDITYEDLRISHNTIVTQGGPPILNQQGQDMGYRSLEVNNWGPEEDNFKSKMEDINIHHNLFYKIGSSYKYIPISYRGDTNDVIISHNFWSEDSGNKQDTNKTNPKLVGMDGNGSFEAIDKLPPGGYEEIRSWFKLQDNSPAINASVDSDEAIDHWKSKRDDKPDVGTHEFGGKPEPTNTPSPTKPLSEWDLNQDNIVNPLDFPHLISDFVTTYTFPSVINFISAF